MTKEATDEPLLRSSCKRFGASFPHRNYYSVSIQLFPPLLVSFLPSIIRSEEGKERKKSLPSPPTTGTSCLTEGHGFVFGRTWKTPSGAKRYSVGTYLRYLRMFPPPSSSVRTATLSPKGTEERKQDSHMVSTPCQCSLSLSFSL